MSLYARARNLAFALLILVFSRASGPAVAAPWQDKVEAGLLTSSTQGETEFLVLLQEQANLRAAEALQGRAAKGAYVVQQLMGVAERTQEPLLAELQAGEIPHRSYWVANMVWVRGGQETLRTLAMRPDVSRVFANPSVQLDPGETLPSPALLTGQAASVAWGVAKVRAPEVWAAGFTGQGVVIGGQDTGYDWEHPALQRQYRGWDGAQADHNYNWHDAIHVDNATSPDGNPCGFDLKEPCDDSEHGTHTMGTMVGDDGQGNRVGMAPGARWIGCRNMENGWGTPQTYAECFQWFLAPTDLNGQNPDPARAPDVINNSWGCPPSEGCEWDSLQTVIENVRAAGILVVVSAGNAGGQGCSSVNDPPAIYEASFTVGSTDSSDRIAFSSSRGPADWTGRPKPNVSAPGVGVPSSVPGGGYASMTGTSMAAPHVSGLAALLLSAQPGLSGQVDRLEDLIEGSALSRTDSACGDQPGQIPNNVYGWGRIDAFAALQRIGSLQISKRVSTAIAMPGDVITYTLAVTNDSTGWPLEGVVLTDTLPAGADFVAASEPYVRQGDEIRWEFESLGAAESRQATLVVRVSLTYAATTLTNQSYGAGSLIAIPVTGLPVITQIRQPGAPWLFFPLITSPLNFR